MPGHRVLAWRNGPRLDGRYLMGTLMVDFITSLEGYGLLRAGRVGGTWKAPSISAGWANSPSTPF
jgi:hypothetical protein